jgi:hypothetical protein
MQNLFSCITFLNAAFMFLIFVFLREYVGMQGSCNGAHEKANIRSYIKKVLLPVNMTKIKKRMITVMHNSLILFQKNLIHGLWYMPTTQDLIYKLM